MSQLAKSSRTVKGAAALIMATMFVSRLLGWVKFTAMSTFFGRTLNTDAFIGAIVIPDTVYMLLSGGALTAAFIPLFTGYIAAGKEKDGWRLACAIWNQTAAVLLVLIILGEIFSSKVILMLPGFHDKPEALAAGAGFVRLLLPMVFFTALAALCNGALQSYNHFAAPAASWIIYNLCFIASAFIFHKTLGLSGVCLGMLAGAILMVLVQLPGMWARGGRYYFDFGRGNPDIKVYWKTFLPVMLGMSLSQLNLMIMPTIFGSLVGAGAITALSYANRIMFIPLGVFGSAISMAIFPSMAYQAAAGDKGRLDHILIRGLRSTLMFALPCSALLITAGLPAVRIVFGYGRFKYGDCVATASALTFFAIGLVGHSINQIINRGFYSRKDTMTPVVAGVVGVLVTVPLAYILIKTPLRQNGVALAVSIAALLNMMILVTLAKVKLSLDLSQVIPMFLKTLFASVMMGIVGWRVGGLFHLGPEHFGLHNALAALAAIGISSCGLFAILAKIMKIEEFGELVGMFTRKLGFGK